MGEERAVMYSSCCSPLNYFQWDWRCEESRNLFFWKWMFLILAICYNGAGGGGGGNVLSLPTNLLFLEFQYVNFISIEVGGGWEFQLDSRHPPYRYVTQEGRGAVVEIPHWSVFYYGSPLSSLSPPSQEMVNHCPALIFLLPMGLTSGPSHHFPPCFWVWRYIRVFHIFFIISMGLAEEEEMPCAYFILLNLELLLVSDRHSLLSEGNFIYS